MKWKQPTPSRSLRFREGGGVASSPRSFAGALGWVCRVGDPLQPSAFANPGRGQVTALRGERL